jgi:hypothetical protein
MDINESFSFIKGHSILCLMKHDAMETYSVSGGISPRILNLGSREMLVVIFTLRPLYSCAKSYGYSLDRMMCGPLVGLDEVGSREIPFFAPPGNRTRSSSPQTISYSVCVVYVNRLFHVLRKDGNWMHMSTTESDE